MEMLLSIEFGGLLSIGIVIFVGLFVGMLMGALPGLGLMIAITLLLPISYSLSPVESILLLLATYQGSEYGGSISAITLGIPGTAMAAATVLDGQPMAQNKSPGKALAYSLTASTIGGIFGGLVLVFLAKPLSSFALKLGDPEYFLLGILGLIAIAAIGSSDGIKSLVSIILGLLVATVGTDIFTGFPRFTFGAFELYEGMNLIAVVVGLFAFTEIFIMLTGNLNKRNKVSTEDLKIKLTMKEFKEVFKSTTIGSITGALIGILPGLGSNASSWFAYSFAKKASKTPEEFGKGSPEGLTAPEAANNATVGGALLPLLTLGIPGSPSIAIIAGAFIIHGIQPGPQVLMKNPELINAIFIGFFFTTIGMYIMGKFMTTGFARLLVTPNAFLVPVITVLSIIGVYASQGNHFDLWLALGIGIIALVLRAMDFSIATFVLAFVLGPIIEEGFRRALILSEGSYSIFVTRPISIFLILVMIAFVLPPFIRMIKKLIIKNKTA